MKPRLINHSTGELKINGRFQPCRLSKIIAVYFWGRIPFRFEITRTNNKVQNLRKRIIGGATGLKRIFYH